MNQCTSVNEPQRLVMDIRLESEWCDARSTVWEKSVPKRTNATGRSRARKQSPPAFMGPRMSAMKTPYAPDLGARDDRARG